MDTPEPEMLPLPQRLALSYAPQSARSATLALLAFDTRLAALVSGATEPLLGQIRLAWWRDTLRSADSRPRGDPVFEALTSNWGGEEAALVGLVDGWEGLLSEGPLAQPPFASLVAARGEAFAGLARILGFAEAAADATMAGRRWAVADLVEHLSDPDERAAVLRLPDASSGSRASLPRALRPLAVLDGLARRSISGGGTLLRGRSSGLAAMRLGLFGR